LGTPAAISPEESRRLRRFNEEQARKRSIGCISSRYHAEIEEALARAQQLARSAESALSSAKRKVALPESMLELRDSTSHSAETQIARSASSEGPMTLHAAMHRVLMDAPGRKLRAGEIIAEIEQRGLYRMRDGRLPESQQIHARVGHYPEMFGKEGSLFFPR
jgi:hypothetical protein